MESSRYDDWKLSGPEDYSEYEVETVQFNIDIDVPIITDKSGNYIFDFDNITELPIKDDIVDSSTGQLIIDEYDLNTIISEAVVADIPENFEPGMHNVKCHVELTYEIWDTLDDPIEFDMNKDIDVTDIVLE